VAAKSLLLSNKGMWEMVLSIVLLLKSGTLERDGLLNGMLMPPMALLLVCLLLNERYLHGNLTCLMSYLDLSVIDSDAIHLLYKSGSFIQHDLRTVSRPLDHMPRQALSWTARSSLVFVADTPRPFDPPYDDL
jgi:hypothetical protein